MNKFDTKEKIEKIIEGKKEEEKIIEEFVNKISNEITAELDELFKRINNKLLEMEVDFKNKGTITQIDDHLLDIWAVKIPMLMYYTGKDLDDMIVQNEIAKFDYQTAYDGFLLQMEGTIPEKEANARLMALEEKYYTLIKTGIQKKVDRQLKYAQALFDGVRKVMQKRIEELRTFRNELNVNRSSLPFRSEEDDDE